MVCYGRRPEGDRSRDRDSRWLSILTLSQNREFPEYMQELKGMADGAQVDFAEALMYTMEEEFSYHRSRRSCATASPTIAPMF